MKNRYQFQIISELSDSQINDLWQLYKNEWWSKNRTLDQTKKICLWSDILIGITLNTGQLVGFARVLTDFVAPFGTGSSGDFDVSN